MITVTLVGGQTPRLVQIVVDEAPDGEPWTLTGTDGEYTWTVPGGAGVGDGEQLTLVDNRTPGNRPITYTFTTTTTTEVADPITVPFPGDFVIQSLDGQKTLTVGLLRGSLDIEMESGQAVYPVPGRRRPPVRYSVTSDVSGTFGLLINADDTAAFKSLLATGQPLLYRCGDRILDLDPVGVFTYGNPSAVAYVAARRRVWTLPYRLVDDPYMDRRLGAFSWDTFDDVWAGKTWDEFDAFMADKTWDEFDTFDWSTLL